ncbi:unnamed protein product [Cylindrotheca closterium]|uniref:Protochlorophyllide reductase n=1 Tax=Cylindrotheca closterium TaxID=2856 RepID=A0AAD2G077_9STRA|nr:unnamed protein product [Cylindrotheca closterium]
MNVAKGIGASAAILGASALLLRHSISRKWIDYRACQRDLDLNDKVYVITGGNTGLGYETAKDLAERGATVVIACRDMEKGFEAMESIMKATGNPDVECLELDLCSLASVREFVKTIQSHRQYSTIDGLILNAGVWVPPAETATSDDADESEPLASSPTKTQDGYEIHFGVNHLGHFFLANSLVENVKKSGDGRIVFVASSLLKSGKLNFEAYDHIYSARQIPPGEKKGFAPPAYCDSKLFNALTCKQLATILPPEVTTYSVCPGFCRSELGRHANLGMVKKMLATPIMRLIQRTTTQGAQNIVFCALEDKKNLKSGACYADGEISKKLAKHVDSFGIMGPKSVWSVSDMLVKDAAK